MTSPDRLYLSPPHIGPDEFALVTEALGRMLAVVQPERVVLFGSYARGEAGPDSDLDLLVVSAFEGPRSRLALRILEALAPLPVSKDVFVLTPSEWSREQDVPGTLAYPAAREGVVLYES